MADRVCGIVTVLLGHPAKQFQLLGVLASDATKLCNKASLCQAAAARPAVVGPSPELSTLVYAGGDPLTIAWLDIEADQEGLTGEVELPVQYAQLGHTSREAVVGLTPGDVMVVASEAGRIGDVLASENHPFAHVVVDDDGRLRGA